VNVRKDRIGMLFYSIGHLLTAPLNTKTKEETELMKALFYTEYGEWALQNSDRLLFKAPATSRDTPLKNLCMALTEFTITNPYRSEALDTLLAKHGLKSIGMTPFLRAELDSAMEPLVLSHDITSNGFSEIIRMRTSISSEE